MKVSYPTFKLNLYVPKTLMGAEVQHNFQGSTNLATKNGRLPSLYFPPSTQHNTVGYRHFIFHHQPRYKSSKKQNRINFPMIDGDHQTINHRFPFQKNQRHISNVFKNWLPGTHYIDKRVQRQVTRTHCIDTRV